MTNCINFSVAKNCSKEVENHPKEFNTKQIEGLCKIWGFLKYYHPIASENKIDWDLILVNKANDFCVNNSSEKYNSLIMSMIDTIDNFGKIVNYKFKKTCTNKETGINHKLHDFSVIRDINNYYINVDFEWIKDTIFSDDVKQYLTTTLIKHQPFTNKYIKSKGKIIKHIEKDYLFLDSISNGYMLLGLFKYWNTINYFYPHKKLLKTSWEDVLNESINNFRDIGNYKNYIDCILYLVSKTNDSHGLCKLNTTKYFNNNNLKLTNKGYIPYNFKFLNGRVVVSQNLSDSSILNIGDTVIKINEINLEEYRNKIHHSKSFSTIQSELVFFESSISKFRDNVFKIYALKNDIDTIIVEEVKNVDFKLKMNSFYYSTKPYYFQHDNDFLYIDLTQISALRLIKLFKQINNNIPIIFDLRGLPETIAPLMLPQILNCKKDKPVASFFYAESKVPGVFKKSEKHVKYNYLFARIITIFNKSLNNDIVVLVNGETISYGETVCMIFKTIVENKITLVGSTTAGTNGNITSLKIPGGLTLYYTSIDWQFPDGKQIQMKGIQPDICVPLTAEGLKNNKDEILDAAIKYIKNLNK